jgi:pimeloyl-ACP methyl ester carboxylesterase
MKFFSLIGFGLLVLFGMGMHSVAAQEDAPLATGFTACEVKVNGKKVAAACGNIEVPENRETAVSRTITLPITKIKAVNPIGDPVFHLAGGPGTTNMKFQPPASLLENHDVVLVGYRGVDGSQVLDCPEVAKAMKGDGQNLLSDASIAAIGDSFAECGVRLREAGVDLDGYNVREVAQDIEAARQALGYDKINLLSESYGTRVAQVYAALYPERVARSVMIGANPPGHFLWEPDVIDQQVADYASLCAADADCAARTDDLAATMRQVNETMPDNWLFLSIDPGKVKAMSFLMMFNRTTAVHVIDAYLSAAEGDYSGLALMSLAYNQMLPKMMTWGDFLSKGFSADFDPDRDYSNLAAPESIMGSPMSEILWPVGSEWPMARLPELFNTPQLSEVETLIVSGNLDFSTPAQAATEELLPTLSNGQQIILTDFGHTEDFWKVNPQAAEQLLVQYFADGTLDDSGFSHVPMTFDGGLLTAVAKSLIIVPLLLLVVVAVVIGLLIRKRRS